MFCMDNRIDCVREYVDNIFDGIGETENKHAAYIHSYGVSQCCALLALKRGLDVELATVMGLLHDVYSYSTGITKWHSHNGAEMVRVAFKHSLAGLFSDDEQILIKSAIFHHSDKDHVHDEYDELLKDSDILQHLSFDAQFGWIQGHRLNNVLKELQLPEPKISILPQKGAIIKPFVQSLVGDIAGTLAKRKIAGEGSDPDFMRLIRYYPEANAINELKNSWCAAFVFHCCFEAGLSLPIRIPDAANKTVKCRFAGVGAWYEWGMENGFCRFENDGFAPERGDIIIYSNIIPNEDKPENSAWHDHIGIVLSADLDYLIVAEGNADNRNVSDIIRRRCGDKVGCYIRIPRDYSYDRWETDFKTGEKRVQTPKNAHGKELRRWRGRQR